MTITQKNTSSTECDPRIRHLIKELRNRRGVKENWKELDKILCDEIDLLVKNTNLRWLISICDTIVDHDKTERRFMALSITTFVNTFRIAEMVKLTRAKSIEKVDEIDFYELYEGITTFSVKKQDTFLNLSRRMKWTIRKDLLMTRIWDEVVNRIHASDNVMREFIASSDFPERYIPANPEGLKDNYGLTYEDLYPDLDVSKS
ncbi:hypothetical protein VB716_17300 [Synechococcus sp. CCY9201]|uniref:hypothetical protein n=1 Tax=Synechococcus sp. CCY9201 TaxID=174697 RepID=UPI002B21DD2E|nr:hypothetical protein [Synechococcus sp. CCY9201]MEA5475974.1 hypothetical protein [Synechococcus sp. CCY9201]